MKEISSGVWPVMTTPFTDDNKIDERALEAQIEWYIAKGCDGLFAVCQSSEMYYLTLEERVKLASLSVKFAAKRLPVIAAGSLSTEFDEQRREMDALISTGIDAFVLLSNRFAQKEETDHVWTERVQRILDAYPEPQLGIYECPHPYNRLLSLEALAWVVKTKRFGFIKDTCCNAETIKQRLGITNGSGVKLFNANTMTLLESLKAGAAGFCGLMANLHPQLYKWLIANHEKEPSKAEVFQAMLTLLSNTEGQAYPVSAKQHMVDEGIDMTLRCRCINMDQFKPKHLYMLRQAEKIEKKMYEMLGIAY